MNIKKSILVTVLILTLISTAAFASGGNFEDVPSNAWYKNSLDHSVNEGLINGYPDGTFKPEETLTRAEFTKVVVYALYGKQEKGLNLFKKWHTPYYEKGKEEGLLPESFTNLDKNSPVTRGEMAVVIANIDDLELDTSKGKSDIEDYSDIPSSQKSAVIKTYQSGIINGYPDGTFKAKETLTRAQLAKVAQLIDDRSAIDEQQPTTSEGTKNSEYGEFMGMDRKEWDSQSIDEKLNAWNGWTYDLDDQIGDTQGFNSTINENPLLFQQPKLDTAVEANTYIAQASSRDGKTWLETNSQGQIFTAQIDVNSADVEYEDGIELLEKYLSQMETNPYKIRYKRTLNSSQIDKVISKLEEVTEIDKEWKEENADALVKTFDPEAGYTQIDYTSLEKPIPEAPNSVVSVDVEGYRFYYQPKGGIVVMSMLDTEHPDFDSEDFFEYKETVDGDYTYINFGDDWE